MDFQRGGSVNPLILIALGWTAAARARVRVAALTAVPALAFLVLAVAKLISGVPPETGRMTLLGLGALAVNPTCALMPARHRQGRRTLTEAAFLCARNGGAANVALIGAGLVTLDWASIWPDLIVCVALAAINVDAARVVWHAASVDVRATGNSDGA